MRDSLARSWVEVDRGALIHNFSVATRCAGNASVMAVIKADAYGHGAVEAARTLSANAAFFGVANVREALELRRSGVATPVFLLGPLLPEERVIAAREGFIATVSNLDEARVYATLGAEVHLAVDTGMGRIGVLRENALSLARKIAALPDLRLTGITTHLPSADDDVAFTEQQLAAYRELTARIKAEIPSVRYSHVLNSAGILGFGNSAHDIVRAGLMLYGVSPLPEYQAELRAAMTWKTRVTLVREVPEGHGISYGRTYRTSRPMRIATLGVGYADGYPRILSGRGAEVLVGGVRCAVLGRVTMDQILADVTHLPEVEAGAEVVLLGRQGDAEISATEFAARAQTIAWEIFTGVQQRVARVYL